LFLQNGSKEVERVATLNVKNLPDGLYRKLQRRARLQHRSVAQEVTHILSEALDAGEPLSILELRGLGKEHWRGMDATEHVEAERRSWD
jgi:plasmid stability protein